MQISFRTKDLEACFLQHRQAVRRYGEVVAKRYIQRIGLLKAARSREEIAALPGLRFHPLTGDRLGQFAVNLTGFERLILTFPDDQPNTVRIEEVSKHYGD